MKLYKRLDKLETQWRLSATGKVDEYCSLDDMMNAMEIIGYMELIKHYPEIKANTEREEQKEPPGRVEYDSDFLAWVPLELGVKIQAGCFERSKVVRAYLNMEQYCKVAGRNFEDERKQAMEGRLMWLEFLDRLVRADRVPYIDWIEQSERQARTDLEKRSVEIIRQRVERIRQWKIALGVDNRWVRDVPTWEEYIAGQQDDNESHNESH